jgi:pseudouridine-5'-phosphate glycosidase
VLAVSEEVSAALAGGAPVVALETTIVAHGFPAGEGLAVGRECETRIRKAGAVPATVAVLDGALRIGLSAAELERVASAGPEARKVGPRDIGLCLLEGAIGATTVGGTLAACGPTDIRVFATGGLGGVHRGWTERPDVSSDLWSLAHTPVLVVCSGIKSLLDVAATMEALETLGVPALGWQTDELPLFYTARGGPPVQRLETVEDAARLASLHWAVSGSAVVLARPPLDGIDDVEPLIQEALAAAAASGVTGQAVTPFVLAHLHRHSDGRTLDVNRRLAADNACLAAQVAVAFTSTG